MIRWVPRRASGCRPAVPAFGLRSPRPGDAIGSGDVPAARLRLAVVGDVGHPSPELDATVAALVRASTVRRFDGLVLLGDNVYPDGDPSRVEEAVLEPFRPLLREGVPLLPVLGNHDVQASSGDDLVRLLGMPGRWYSLQLPPLLFVGLDSTRPHDGSQRAWLERTLACSNSAWTVVALHHPPYSAGWHGSDRSVRRAFTPLFRRFGVDLVLAGHEHDYQRSRPVRGTTYVISGAATHLRPTGQASFTAAAHSTHHFVDLRVVAGGLELRAVGHDGRVFDGVALSTRRAAFSAVEGYGGAPQDVTTGR